MNCTRCGAPTISCLRWRGATAEERRQFRERMRGNICRRCYDGDRRGPRKSWKLDDLLEEAEVLFSADSDVRNVAKRLGLKPESLVRQYRRAEARGMTTRHLTYTKERGLR